MTLSTITRSLTTHIIPEKCFAECRNLAKMLSVILLNVTAPLGFKWIRFFFIRALTSQYDVNY